MSFNPFPPFHFDKRKFTWNQREFFSPKHRVTISCCLFLLPASQKLNLFRTKSKYYIAYLSHIVSLYIFSSCSRFVEGGKEERKKEKKNSNFSFYLFVFLISHFFFFLTEYFIRLQLEMTLHRRTTTKEAVVKKSEWEREKWNDVYRIWHHGKCWKIGYDMKNEYGYMWKFKQISLSLFFSPSAISLKLKLPLTRKVHHKFWLLFYFYVKFHHCLYAQTFDIFFLLSYFFFFFAGDEWWMVRNFHISDERNLWFCWHTLTKKEKKFFSPVHEEINQEIEKYRSWRNLGEWDFRT